MAGKIYVRQTAVFHADTKDEVDEMLTAAVRLIKDGGGAVERMSAVETFYDADNDRTFVCTLEYQVLKTAL